MSRDEVRAATARFPGLAALAGGTAGSGAQPSPRGTLELVPARPVTGTVAEFALEDLPVGSPDVAYHDPEFLPGGNKMTFYDRNLDVWVAELDGKTGLLRSQDGRDLLVDRAMSPMKDSGNGPEWALDRRGVSLVYTKPDARSVPQVWTALLKESGKSEITQLTTSHGRSVQPICQPQSRGCNLAGELRRAAIPPGVARSREARGATQHS